jgi:hypothetical protein
MADDVARQQTTGEADPSRGQSAVPSDEPLPTVDDPGGAHAKGYSAEPGPELDIEGDDPVPLATGPEAHPAVRVPERDNQVQATGRRESGGYSPNDRLIGSDR